MKKILIGVVIILLIVLAYFAIFEGITLGSFSVLSVGQIADENQRLEDEIQQVEVLKNSDYPNEMDKLEESIAGLLTAKGEYQDLASISTEGELKEASQEETYTVEYLWTRFGRHATREGVNLTYTLSTGTTGEAEVKNITFTVEGEYPAIITFLTALEDDSELGFRIENFKLVPGGSHLQATFLVRNVRVKDESVSSSVQTQSTTTQTTDTAEDVNTQTQTENQNETTDNTVAQ